MSIKIAKKVNKMNAKFCGGYHDDDQYYTPHEICYQQTTLTSSCFCERREEDWKDPCGEEDENNRPFFQTDKSVGRAKFCEIQFIPIE